MIRTFVLAAILSVATQCAPATVNAHPLYPGLNGPKSEQVQKRATSKSVELSRKYLGTNPTKMRRVWCANFMNMIERKQGRTGTGSNRALSFASYGKAVKPSQVKPGDIAVMRRKCKGCGHVGYFVRWDGKGRAVLISGNARGGKVAEGSYQAGRIIAWRRPA